MQLFSKDNVKRAVSVIIIGVLVLCMDRGLGFLLEPVTYSMGFDHDIEMIEKEDHDPAVIFIGASRCYRSFVPQVFEEKWGTDCVINAGTAMQPVKGTYYLLKDLIERTHPGKVYLCVTIDQLVSKGKSTQRKMLVYDRLSPKNRILMGIDCYGLKERLYLLDTYRYRDRFDFDTIRSGLAEKAEVKRSDYKTIRKRKEYYLDRGFIYSDYSYVTGTIPIKGKIKFSEDRIKSENLRYLDKCIEMCKENDIEVNLLTGVTSVMRIYHNSDYQAVVDFYQKYASEKGVKYYNLNYLKGREQILPDELMFDYNHVNGEGAYLVSGIFADLVLEEEAGKDISSYFYKDVDEFKKDVQRIVAVKAEVEPDEKNKDTLNVHITSLQNDDIRPIYRLLIRSSEKEDYRVVHDWSGETDVTIQAPKEKGYEIKVEAAAEDSSYGTASQEYEF